MPDVSFGIAAREGLAVVVFALQFNDYLRPGSFHFGIYGVTVGYDEVWCLRLRTTNFIRLFHGGRRPRSVFNRADHDHAVSERELSMHDANTGAGVDRMFLKARKFRTARRSWPSHCGNEGQGSLSIHIP